MLGGSARTPRASTVRSRRRRTGSSAYAAAIICMTFVGSSVGELSLLASMNARLSCRVACPMTLLCKWLASTGSFSCKLCELVLLLNAFAKVAHTPPRAFRSKHTQTTGHAHSAGRTA